jgi:hypothetical protein
MVTPHAGMACGRRGRGPAHGPTYRCHTRESAPLGCSRDILVGPKAGSEAQVSLLPFSFSFMFYFLFYFIPNYFESNLNLIMSFSFEPIIQIQILI